MAQPPPAPPFFFQTAGCADRAAPVHHGHPEQQPRDAAGRGIPDPEERHQREPTRGRENQKRPENDRVLALLLLGNDDHQGKQRDHEGRHEPHAPGKRKQKEKKQSRSLSISTVAHLDEMEEQNEKKEQEHYKERLVKNHIECLRSLLKSYEINLALLWPNGSVEVDFRRAILSSNLKMLESRELNKFEEARAIIFSVIEQNIEDSTSSKDISERLRHRIYEDETLVETISTFLIRSYKSDVSCMVQLVNDTMSNLFDTLMEKTNYNTESQAVKNAKELMTRLAMKIPKLFNNKFSSVLKLYSSDAYMIRNSVSDIITQIILQLLKENPDLDTETREMHLKARIRHLEILSDRIFDKNAFCRSHALSDLIEICQNNCLPRELIISIMERAFGRVRDMAVLVRKKAIQLIYELIKLYVGVTDESNIKDFSAAGLSKELIKRDLALLDKEIEENNAQLGELTAKMNTFSEENEEFQELYTKWQEQKDRKKKLEEMKEFVSVSWRVVEFISKAIPDLTQLLFSKNNSDVTESIRIFFLLKKLGVSEAEVGMKKMVGLIWSKEDSVKDAVVKAYFDVYFNPRLFSVDGIANNLIANVTNANLSELTSFEKLVSELIRTEEEEKMMLDEKKNPKNKTDAPIMIEKRVFTRLWDIFIKLIFEENNSLDKDSEEFAKNKGKTRAILRLIRIVVEKDINIVLGYVKAIQNVAKGFLQGELPVDWIIFKEICSIVSVFQVQKSDGVEIILRFLLYILIKFHGTMDNEWLCACEQYVRTIFLLKKNPEKIMHYLLNSLSKFLYLWERNEKKSTIMIEEEEGPGSTRGTKRRNDGSVPIELELSQGGQVFSQSAQKTLESFEQSGMPLEAQSETEFEQKLAQLVFLAGQVVLMLLLHCDKLENHLQKQKIEEERRKQIEQMEAGTKEDELDKVSGGLDAEFEKKREELHRILENKLVTSDENFLGTFFPLVKAICIRSYRRGYTANPVLERAAALTLSKYMCVSTRMCSEENLHIIFSLLDAKIDSIIKINLIIAMGDLIQRFPNIVEGYTGNLYKNLHDSEATVRKTTLMVLTHLILNDMLKLKGEICDLAQLLNDEDPKIRNFVKIFFNELNKKDSKIIYNLLPEAISKMSKEKMNEQIFQEFARNLMQYLEKEKYSESLVDKLCLRFKNSDDLNELRNTSFCLSLLNYNEKATKKLIEHFENYRDRLKDQTINGNFHNVLIKIKKTQGKIEKKDIEDFETRLQNFAEIHIERTKKEVKGNKKRGKQKGNEEEGGSKKPLATQRKGRSLNRIRVKEEEDEEDEEVEFGETIAATRPKRAAARPLRRVAVEREEDEDEEDSKMVLEVADDEDDDSESYH